MVNFVLYVFYYNIKNLGGKVYIGLARKFIHSFSVKCCGKTKLFGQPNRFILPRSMFPFLIILFNY